MKITIDVDCEAIASAVNEEVASVDDDNVESAESVGRWIRDNLVNVGGGSSTIDDAIVEAIASVYK